MRRMVHLFLVIALLCVQNISLAQNTPAYLSGGFGNDEQNTIKSQKHQYNLRFIFALLSDGAYAAEVKSTVFDAQGKQIFSNGHTGPYFYIKLPPGEYVFTFDYGTQTQTFKLKAAEGQATDTVVRW